MLLPKKINQDSKTKNQLTELALRLEREHGESNLLNMHGDHLLPVIGAIVEYVELLEARIDSLEQRSCRNWWHWWPHPEVTDGRLDRCVFAHRTRPGPEVMDGGEAREVIGGQGDQPFIGLSLIHI